MSKITVIVPVYNVEKYLLGCLKSVASQTFKDFECICVDDGSTDNSPKIADDFALTDARFNVIHQKNAGLSAARNAGMKNTSAPFVFFLDSDDYLHPKTLETIISVMEKNQVSVVNCGVKNTNELYNEKLEDLNISNYKIEIIKNPLNAFLKRRDIKTGACFRLYKRSIIQNIPFIEGISFEDVPFTTKLMNQIDKMAFINAPFYYYYKNPNSIMRSSFSTSKIDSYNRIIRTLAQYFKQESPEKFCLVQRYVFNQRIKMMLNQCVRKQKNAAKQKELFDYAMPIVKSLYNEKLISYKGLKLKHKIALWLLISRKNSKYSLAWCRLLK